MSLDEHEAGGERAALPAPFDAWLTELLPDPIPAETECTCHDCIPCRPPERGGPPRERGFSPQVKCCSYHPELPNFLVGALLARDDPDPSAVEARATLERRIDTGFAFTPFGLEPPPVFARLYEVLQEPGFGRSTALRCPFFDAERGGRCGIWAHRSGVCSTWFCRHLRLGTGQSFWARLRDLMVTVESELKCWCLLELGLDPDLLEPYWPKAQRDRQAPPGRAVDANSLSERASPEIGRLWGPWHGRERELLAACWALVAPLTWADVKARCGPDTELAERRLRRAYARLTEEEIPRRLRLTAVHFLPNGPSDEVELTLPGSLDVITTSRDVLGALAHFDGDLTEVALQRIGDELGLEIDEATLLQFVDAGILVEPER